MDRSDLNQEGRSHAVLNVSNVFDNKPISEQANDERILQHTSAAIHRAAVAVTPTRDDIGCPTLSEHLEARYSVEGLNRCGRAAKHELLLSCDICV